jgi:hypothetical protein
MEDFDVRLAVDTVLKIRDEVRAKLNSGLPSMYPSYASEHPDLVGILTHAATGVYLINRAEKAYK